MLAKLGRLGENQHNLSKIETFHLSLKSVCSPKMFGELGRFPFRTSIETQLFKYLERIPTFRERRLVLMYTAFNEELVNQGVN